MYKEFLIYMQTIKGKSQLTISEYSSDLKIFFKYMKMHFGLADKTDELDEIEISDLDYAFVDKIKLYDIYD